MQVPDDRRYSKEHLWALPQDDTTVLAGITDFAQDELGEIVFVELPSPGTAVKQAEVMGQVESLKTVSDLYAPVSGEVIEVNPEVSKSPDLLNTDPYNKGWLVRIRPGGTGDMGALLDATAYEELTGSA